MSLSRSASPSLSIHVGEQREKEKIHTFERHLTKVFSGDEFKKMDLRIKFWPVQHHFEHPNLKLYSLQINKYTPKYLF